MGQRIPVVLIAHYPFSYITGPILVVRSQLHAKGPFNLYVLMSNLRSDFQKGSMIFNGHYPDHNELCHKILKLPTLTVGSFESSKIDPLYS